MARIRAPRLTFSLRSMLLLMSVICVLASLAASSPGATQFTFTSCSVAGGVFFGMLIWGDICHRRPPHRTPPNRLNWEDFESQIAASQHHETKPTRRQRYWARQPKRRQHGSYDIYVY